MIAPFRFIPDTGNGFQFALVIGAMELFFYMTDDIVTAAGMDL